MSFDPDALIDRRRLKRGLWTWRIVALLAVCALIGVIAARGAGKPGAHVARVDIDGLIVEDAERAEALDALMEDEEAKAVLVRINSPGGTTTGSEALYQRLRALAAEKPTVALIGSIGASGGYITAIAADHIIARETSLTASIGVVMQTAEFTRLLDDIGVKTDTLKSGDVKGAPSPMEPLSPASRASLMAAIDDSFAWFSELVRKRRPLDESQWQTVSDGRIVTGRMALKLGLVDGLGGESEARDWLQSRHDIAADLPAVDVTWGEESLPWLGGGEALARKLLKSELLNAGVALDGLMAIWQP